MEGFIHSPSTGLPNPTKKIHEGLATLATTFSARHPKLGKFHEWLGYQFATMLAQDPVLAPDELVRAFLRRAIELARDVWSREITETGVEHGNGKRGNFTPILSSLLSGDLDADRMDFVRRDSLFSGLFACSVDFGRLFDLYEADENKDSDNDGNPIGWVARPSCRSASDAAKLLIERFQLYKYVVAHHRVHLFDELLERCLIELMRAGRLDQLLGDVSGVLNAPTGRADTTSGQAEQLALRKHLLHLDDAWVDSQVRAWDVAVKAPVKMISTDLRCKTLFGALLEKRSRFRSVFKWDRDFTAWWDIAFAEGPVADRFHEWLSAEAKETRDAASLSAFTDSLRTEVQRRCRLKIIGVLFGHRYKFEEWLCEEAAVPAVIVGVTGRKVRGQMKSAEEAEFFGLTAVNDYLTAATVETMVFNIWFVPGQCEQADERAALLQKSLEWLAANLLTRDVFNFEANEAWKEVTMR